MGRVCGWWVEGRRRVGLVGMSGAGDAEMAKIPNPKPQTLQPTPKPQMGLVWMAGAGDGVTARPLRRRGGGDGP
jgi:hypothetical protein